MLARVRHPNVVAVYGAQQRDTEIGLWMELLVGQPLSELVRRQGPMAPAEAAVIGMSLCHAVAAVHGAGLLHRDIKAHNIMRETGGRIVLMDFGAGHVIADGRPAVAEAVGTPLYMAPEILVGRPASPESDIYSLGVLLFFLVSGQYPLHADTLTELMTAHGLGRRRPLADCRPDLPDSFIRVVDRALSPEAAERYPSPGALLRDLGDAISREPLSLAGVQARTAEGGAPSAHTVAERGPFRQVEPRLIRTAFPARAMSPPIVWLGFGSAILLAVGVLGFLTTIGFDVALRRDSGFSNESLFAWWVWGIRSLIGPAVYAMLAVLLIKVMQWVWRLTRAIPGLRQLTSPIARGGAALVAACERIDTGLRAQALVIGQIVSLGAVLWFYRDLVGVLGVSMSTAPDAALAILAPERSFGHFTFRVTLALLVLATATGWYFLTRSSGDGRAKPDRATTAAGMVVLSLTLVVMELPYRLLWQNEFERVAFGDERCYAIGARADDLLLFCPDAAPPRNKVVPRERSRTEALDGRGKHVYRSEVMSRRVVLSFVLAFVLVGAVPREASAWAFWEYLRTPERSGSVQGAWVLHVGRVLRRAGTPGGWFSRTVGARSRMPAYAPGCGALEHRGRSRLPEDESKSTVVQNLLSRRSIRLSACSGCCPPSMWASTPHWMWDLPSAGCGFAATASTASARLCCSQFESP